ncbi:hypothetical protein Sjap_005238 [Stephania japonica]|uniref:Bet v I/Major latex protein domain-containing protein n=1 Tax=Stephania japonica TaxID=461633 RepID=A0AAP0K634_9MAGN
MAQVEKLELACEVSCPADKFYEFMKKDAAQLPQILPKHYKSCELLHGDGKSVGTIRLWKYTLARKFASGHDVVGGVVGHVGCRPLLHAP